MKIGQTTKIKILTQTNITPKKHYPSPHHAILWTPPFPSYYIDKESQLTSILLLYCNTDDSQIPTFLIPSPLHFSNHAPPTLQHNQHNQTHHSPKTLITWHIPPPLPTLHNKHPSTTFPTLSLILH